MAIYTAGLVFWLVLGLLPTLASVFAPVRHWVETVASSSSSLAVPAQRILDANQSMPGMAMEASNGGSVALAYTFSVLNLALGLALMARRPRDLVPRLLALALLGTAATFNKPSHAVFHIIGEPWPVKAVHFSFHVVSGVAYLWAVVLFPDGHLPRRLGLRGKPLAAFVVIASAVIAVVSWRSSFIDHPLFFVVFFGVVISLAGLAAQGLRVSDARATVSERRSCRLLGAGLVPAFVTGLVWLSARATVPFGGPIGLGAEHLDTSLQDVFPAVFAIVPVVLFFGILRYRLWDIDWILSRALLYGTLAVAVGVAYVITVSAVGLGAGGSIWVSVAVLSVVAVAIDPIRGRLRGLCNRLVYGQVLSPTDALKTMLAGLEQLAPGRELSRLTRVVVEATRASSSELWLTSDDHVLRVASFPDDERRPLLQPADGPGPSRERGLTVPVVHRGTTLGVLALELPGAGALGPVEAQLLADLASHAGAVVHNAMLNTELARHVSVLSEQLAELRSSRRRLVVAQDAERRNLERNLHDGAQQLLVAVVLGLRAAGSLAAKPDRRNTEVAEARHLLEVTSTTLDELVSDQGPSTLALLGLAGALTEAAKLASRSGPVVRVLGRVDGNLPPGMAAAVYFCCLEALQNASKHARATTVEVTLSEGDGILGFEVTDNGRGFDPSAAAPTGTGLINLANRLTVVGGAVVVESAPGAGTTVRGWLPVLPQGAVCQPGLS